MIIVSDFQILINQPLHPLQNIFSKPSLLVFKKRNPNKWLIKLKPAHVFFGQKPMQLLIHIFGYGDINSVHRRTLKLIVCDF